eukprot:6707-Rhodomonas_salina.1
MPNETHTHTHTHTPRQNRSSAPPPKSMPHAYSLSTDCTPNQCRATHTYTHTASVQRVARQWPYAD